MSRVKGIVEKFLADTSGAMAALVGSVLVLLTVLGGMAIDLGRWSHSKQVTLASLDAAVLSGAQWLMINPGDAEGAIAVAQNHYNENVKRRFNLEADSVEFVVEDENKSIRATGEATLKTTFMSLAGVNFVPLLEVDGAGLPQAMVGSGGSNIEVSVMLDVTGSMCDDGAGPCTNSVKLDGLKEAANRLVDIVVSSDQSVVTSKVALVPFSTRVRVGPETGGAAAMKTLTNLDATWSGWDEDCVASTGSSGSEGDGDWVCTQTEINYKTDWAIMPCVTDRFYQNGQYFDLTDDAPGVGKWLNAHDGTRNPYFADSTNLDPVANPVGTSTEYASHWNYTDSSGYCSNVQGVNEVMPLTSDKVALKARIDGLRAYGGTSGPLGTAWSWYMLSPKWASTVWTGEAAPGSYADLTVTLDNGAAKLRKVAILMTDGVYNTYGGSKGQDKSWMSATAKQMCENMKAQGIEIFTVGLALDELAPSDQALAVDTLSSCGTDIEHFYNTLSVNQLVQAFHSIGVSLTQVTLTR